MLNDQQIVDILHGAVRDYPRAWSRAHRLGDPERWDWIILAGRRLFEASGGEICCNWRRAVRGDLSMDGLSLLLEDGQWYFADVIRGAGGGNPHVGYARPGHDALLRNSSGEYVGEAGAADPRGLTVVGDQSGGGPVPQPRAFHLGFVFFWFVDGVLNPALHGQWRELVDYIKGELGAEYIRNVWKKGQRHARRDFWAGLVRDEESLTADDARRVLDECGNNGLKMHSTLFADTLVAETPDRIVQMSLDDQARMRDRLLPILVEYRELIIAHQVVNEGYPEGGGHGGYHEDLIAHGGVMRQVFGPDALIGPTSPQAHQPNLNDPDIVHRQMSLMFRVPGLFNFVSVHENRDRNDMRQVDLGQWSPPFIENGEPKGPDTSNGSEWDPATLAEHVRRTKQAGCWGYATTFGVGIHPWNHGTIGDHRYGPHRSALALAIRGAAFEGGSGSGGGSAVLRKMTPYRIQGGAMAERGALIGPRGKYMRIDPGELGQGMWGMTPPGHRIHFDRDTIGDHEIFEIEPLAGDGRFKIRHVATGFCLGADGTEHSGNACEQYYDMPDAQGEFEFWSIEVMANGLTVALINSFTADGRRFASAPLAWQKL